MQTTALQYFPDQEGKPIAANGKAVAYMDTQDHAEFETDEALAAYLQECDERGRLFAASLKLRDSLKDVMRICDAVKSSAGLGKNQLQRLETARLVFAEATGEYRKFAE